MKQRIFFWCVLCLLVLAGCEDQDKKEPAPDSESLDSMSLIQERVSEMRGLESLEEVPKAFMRDEELHQRVENEFFEDYSAQEARDDVLLYAAFDLAELDLDLYKLMIDLYSEQVLGFYDDEKDELFVRQSDEEVGAMERSTFAHEYTHALQDQHFDLEALGLSDDEDEDDQDSEQDFAVRCLVEGDASLLEMHYMMRYFDVHDWQEIMEEVEETDMSILDSAPAILRETLMFPYEAGLAFVTELHAQGGWEAVDAAYANPPLSTEQIMHPERYPDDAPQIVTLPPLTDTLGAGWRMVDSDVLGELVLKIYLETFINISEAQEAAEGWDGDRYAVHWREDESAFVLVLRLAWDSSADAAEFWQAYAAWAEERFGSTVTRSEGDARWWWVGDDVLLLAQNTQEETLIVIAPDEPTLEAVQALFPEF
jgi:hypothetical protein